MQKTTWWSWTAAVILFTWPAAADDAPSSPGPSGTGSTPVPLEQQRPSGSDPSAESGEVGVVPFALVGYTPEMSVVFGAAAVGVYQFPTGSERRDSQLLVSC